MAPSRRWGRLREQASSTSPDGALLASGLPCPSPALAVQAVVQPRAAGLTRRQLDDFVREGFLVLRPRAPAGTHEAIVNDADAAYQAVGFDGTQNSSPIGNNILADVPRLQAVFGSPEVDAALRSLLGDGYIVHPHRRPHQNDPGSFAQTLHKDSHAGFEVHRSHMPWIVMAMYYPQEVTPEGAPTSLCPGTHFYSGEERFDARHMSREEAAATLQRWGSAEQPMTCEGGSVVLVHNDLWHRGTANRSDRRRWMFCFMFMRALSPLAPLQPALETAAQHISPCEVPGPRRLICSQVLHWLEGLPAPALEVDVQAEEAALLSAQDDQERLQAAYALACASNAASASVLLARLLREAAAEPLRRASKFGAAAACHRQLLSGATDMVHKLLEIVEDRTDPGAAACAARALYESGAWGAAPAALRARAVAVLVAAATETSHSSKASRPDTEDSSGPSGAPDRKPVGSGSSYGRVKAWKASQGYGFIQPAVGGDDVFVAGGAFGGGELVVGKHVWYDVRTDARTGKRCAWRVGGPAVSHAGGRRVACRNVRACAWEALAVVPQGAADPAAEVAAPALARELRLSPQGAQRLVGDTSRQEDGEALMAAALGSVRLVSRCGKAVCEVAWWQELRRSLVSLVQAAAAARQQGAARAPGKGGTPGADNGLRYALAYSIEALQRSGDECALMDALSALPDVLASLADGRTTEEALLFRHCHLTTKEHTF